MYNVKVQKKQQEASIELCHYMKVWETFVMTYLFVWLWNQMTAKPQCSGWLYCVVWIVLADCIVVWIVLADCIMWIVLADCIMWIVLADCIVMWIVLADCVLCRLFWLTVVCGLFWLIVLLCGLFWLIVLCCVGLFWHQLSRSNGSCWPPKWVVMTPQITLFLGICKKIHKNTTNSTNFK